MNLFRTSLRIRLTFWYSLALGILLSAFSFCIHLLAERSLLRQLDRELAGRIFALEKSIQDKPGEPEELAEFEDEMFSPVFQVERNDSLLYQSGSWRSAGLVAPGKTGPGLAPVEVRAKDHDYRLASKALEIHGSRYRLFAAMPMDQVESVLAGLALAFKIGLPVGLILAFLGGNVFAGKALAPIGRMAGLAEKISSENLELRLPVFNRTDEIGRLALAFNGVLDRLESSFERLKRFTADASHELRTPLTAIRSVGEVVLRSDSDIGAYREAISSILEESARLSRLVQDLLLLTKGEHDRKSMTRSLLDLGDLTKSICSTFGVLAEEKEQTLVCEVAERIPASVEESTFRLAVMNLIDNAIKHTPMGGAIQVKVWRGASGESLITVRDQGAGIPQEHRQRIFDRFYRVDPGRSRAAGGTGLGLAIARWAAEINDGRLELAESGPGGSLFRITIPHALIS
ncbi:MAG: hypothetical protein JWO30_821 [Fibrobacteres bacterium]|nr:hypothetical protein [Fibrobacterota bacterium]